MPLYQTHRPVAYTHDEFIDLLTRVRDFWTLQGLPLGGI